jgi:hypothetical protein
MLLRPEHSIEEIGNYWQQSHPSAAGMGSLLKAMYSGLPFGLLSTSSLAANFGSERIDCWGEQDWRTYGRRLMGSWTGLGGFFINWTRSKSVLSLGLVGSFYCMLFVNLLVTKLPLALVEPYVTQVSLQREHTGLGLTLKPLDFGILLAKSPLSPTGYLLTALQIPNLLYMVS